MTILNNIKEVIKNSIRVETKAPVVRNGKTKFPILVTDMSPSFTNGWFVQYNPVAQDNGSRLYDGSETFSVLNIARFSELHNLILTGNYYFLQGHAVETLTSGRKRAIYEPDNKVRLTVTSQPNSVNVMVTIVDETSPFYMMSIPFTVTNNGAEPYVVGTEKYWDRNTDTLQEFNANFAPRKARFYRVQQQQNQPASLRAKIAVRNGQYAINQDGTFEVDTNSSAPEYIQVISNEYKALAYIYEQTLMTTAFEMVLAQGLPTAQQPAQEGQTATPNSGFVPAFNVANAGGPAPAPANQGAQFPEQQPNPVQQPAPMQPMQQPVGAGSGFVINPNDLPWPSGQQQ